MTKQVRIVTDDSYTYEMNGGVVVGLQYMNDGFIRLGDEVYAVYGGDGFVPNWTKGAVQKLYRAFHDDPSDNVVDVLWEGERVPIRMKAFVVATEERCRAIRQTEARSVVESVIANVRKLIAIPDDVVLAIRSVDQQDRIARVIASDIERAFSQPPI